MTEFLTRALVSSETENPTYILFPSAPVARTMQLLASELLAMVKTAPNPEEIEALTDIPSTVLLVPMVKTPLTEEASTVTELRLSPVILTLEGTVMGKLSPPAAL